jgi:hypothetical protein
VQLPGASTLICAPMCLVTSGVSVKPMVQQSKHKERLPIDVKSVDLTLKVRHPQNSQKSAGDPARRNVSAAFALPIWTS